MSATTANADLSPAVEEAFCRFILSHTGIAIADHQLTSLRDTVGECCRRFDYRSANQYLAALSRAGDAMSPQLEYLIRGITVGESYFFRDQAQIDLLSRNLLPDIIDRKRQANNRTLRIWSAGCAAGQELYTLAIVLSELLPDIDHWTIHLLGSDINTEILATAIDGHYTNWSLRATPEETVSKYFTRRQQQYTIRPNQRKLAQFIYLNLFTDDYPSLLNGTNALDLILCRNVFIYFDTPSIQRVMQKFTQCLVPGGVILLGASDFYAGNEELLFINDGEALYFQRKTWAEKAASGRTDSQQRHAATATPRSKPTPRKSTPPKPFVKKAATQSQQPPNPVTATSGAGQQDKTDELTQLKDSLKVLLVNEQWREVLAASAAAIDKFGEQALLLQFQAKALANLGRLDEAQSCCEQSLQLDKLDHHSQLLLAIILIERGQLDGAEKALRNALFLEPELLEAHFHLGILYFRMGQRKKGFHCLENALVITENQQPDRQVHNTPALTYGRFAEILRNEIELHKNQGQA